MSYSSVKSTDTVESSLFMGDRCWCILWVTLTHKFTSPRMLIKKWIVMYCNATNQLPLKFHPHYITSKILIIHKHWPLRIRMIPQYRISPFYCIWQRTNLFLCVLIHFSCTCSGNRLHNCQGPYLMSTVDLKSASF